MPDIPKEATRIQVAMTAIRNRIATGSSAKLPSIRQLAETLRVSKSTVVEAYDRLVAEGEVEVRAGSGFFACVRPRPVKSVERGPQLDREIDPLWIMRQALAAREPSLRPGCGWLPDDWLPVDAMRRTLRRATREPGANLTAYGVPQGFAPLRDQLARRLLERNVEADPNAILLTCSATRAIDVVCRFLLRPGDTVLIDDPCYFSYQPLLHAQQVKMIGIPYTPAGPDLERFAAACVEHHPKLYLTTAALHNPTGAAISLSTAHRLLKLAETHDLVLVEDGVYADLEERPSPGLAALDGFGRVIMVGSFSKTLSAALRCGFIVARSDWIESLTDLALATSFGVSDLPAQIMHGLLVDGSYRHHLDGLRPRLARSMAMVIEQLGRMGMSVWTRPSAGMFLWVELPAGLDSSEIAQRALGQNIVLAPGNAFSVSRTAERYLRFNVAQCGDKRLFDLLAKVVGG